MFFVAFTALTFLICCGEAFYERDWPRETFKFFAMCLGGWCLWLLVIVAR
jgi:hypothetical protein